VYWRQVFVAILASITRDLREHPWLAIRSVILTSAVVIARVESTLALYVWVGEKWVNPIFELQIRQIGLA